MSRRSTPEERARLVSGYRRSKLTQREFAEREGITLSTLQGWLYRRTKDKAAGGRFVGVVPATANEAIEIKVGQVQVVLAATTSADRLAAIVHALDLSERGA